MGHYPDPVHSPAQRQDEGPTAKPAPLLFGVASGSQDAARAMIDRYGGLVHALARRFCHQSAEIDDAVQDIFLAVWRSAPRYDPALGSEETFVAMVARRRLIDRQRRAMRRPAPVMGMDLGASVGRPSDEDRETPSEPGDIGQRALRLLQTLRPEQQTVLRLSICRGLSHEEIAALLGMPLGTVKTHVRRGLIALRERLAAEGVTRPDGTAIASDGRDRGEAAGEAGPARGQGTPPAVTARPVAGRAHRAGPHPGALPL